MPARRSRVQEAVSLVTDSLLTTLRSSCGFTNGFRSFLRPRKHVSRSKRQRPTPPLYPPPLPPNRIDVRGQPLARQSTACHLLRLPLELRECIYEQALGGRVIRLRLAASASHRHCVVQSMCYEPVDDVDGGPNKFDVPADRIPVGLLLLCRQVYLEARPILHRRNTYHFWVHELEAVLSSALGRYCLPDIRSIYLCHNYRTLEMPPWTSVFPLLQQMTRLDHLTFEFDVGRLERTEISPHRSVLESQWGCRVVGIRNLRRFELFFKHGDPPEHPVYRANIAQRLRDLMIGPGADERYEMFKRHSRLG